MQQVKGNKKSIDKRNGQKHIKVHCFTGPNFVLKSFLGNVVSSHLEQFFTIIVAKSDEETSSRSRPGIVVSPLVKKLKSCGGNYLIDLGCLYCV